MLDGTHDLPMTDENRDGIAFNLTEKGAKETTMYDTIAVTCTDGDCASVDAKLAGA